MTAAEFEAEPLIGLAETATRLGMPVQTFYDMRKHGRGPAGYVIGGRVKFRWSEVEAWLQTQRETPKTPGSRTPRAATAGDGPALPTAMRQGRAKNPTRNR